MGWWTVTEASSELIIISLELSPEYQAAILTQKRALSQVFGSLPSLGRVPHCTLAMVNPEYAAFAHHTANEIAAGTAPFRVRTQGLKTLPTASGLYALGIGVSQEKELQQLKGTAVQMTASARQNGSLPNCYQQLLSSPYATPRMLENILDPSLCAPFDSNNFEGHATLAIFNEQEISGASRVVQYAGMPPGFTATGIEVIEPGGKKTRYAFSDARKSF